jgi:hypothetical protein
MNKNLVRICRTLSICLLTALVTPGHVSFAATLADSTPNAKLISYLDAVKDKNIDTVLNSSVDKRISSKTALKDKYETALNGADEQVASYKIIDKKYDKKDYQVLVADITKKNKFHLNYKKLIMIGK